MNKLLLLAIFCLLAAAAARQSSFNSEEALELSRTNAVPTSFENGANLMKRLRVVKRSPHETLRICPVGFFYYGLFNICKPCILYNLLLHGAYGAECFS